jgi:hypothetical protein
LSVRISVDVDRQFHLMLSTFSQIPECWTTSPILENSLDGEPLEPVEIPAVHAEVHPNLRGSTYYHKDGELA